jgi:Glutamyl-tRNAGlu reductase, dimerisation domain.
VERALRVLAISDEKFKKVIEAMSKSIVNKILGKTDIAINKKSRKRRSKSVA